MVKKICFTILFLVIAGVLLAQTELITIFDSAPVYKGNLREDLQRQIIYPEAAKKEGFCGVVAVSYVIEKTGETSNHMVVKSVREDLDKEALRVVKTLKYDSPAMQLGKSLSVESVVAVVFAVKSKSIIPKINTPVERGVYNGKNLSNQERLSLQIGDSAILNYSNPKCEPVIDTLAFRVAGDLLYEGRKSYVTSDSKRLYLYLKIGEKHNKYRIYKTKRIEQTTSVWRNARYVVLNSKAPALHTKQELRGEKTTEARASAERGWHFIYKIPRRW